MTNILQNFVYLWLQGSIFDLIVFVHRYLQPRRHLQAGVREEAARGAHGLLPVAGEWVSARLSHALRQAEGDAEPCADWVHRHRVCAPGGGHAFPDHGPLRGTCEWVPPSLPCPSGHRYVVCMWVCMCVCILCVCMRVCVCAYCVYVCACVRAHVHVCVYECVSVHVCTSLPTVWPIQWNLPISWDPSVALHREYWRNTICFFSPTSKATFLADQKTCYSWSSTTYCLLWAYL